MNSTFILHNLPTFFHFNKNDAEIFSVCCLFSFVSFPFSLSCGSCLRLSLCYFVNSATGNSPGSKKAWTNSYTRHFPLLRRCQKVRKLDFIVITPRYVRNKLESNRTFVHSLLRFMSIVNFTSSPFHLATLGFVCRFCFVKTTLSFESFPICRTYFPRLDSFNMWLCLVQHLFETSSIKFKCKWSSFVSLSRFTKFNHKLNCVNSSCSCLMLFSM